MEKKINKRTTKDSIEYLELQCIVNNRIHDLQNEILKKEE